MYYSFSYVPQLFLFPPTVALHKYLPCSKWSKNVWGGFFTTSIIQSVSKPLEARGLFGITPSSGTGLDTGRQALNISYHQRSWWQCPCPWESYGLDTKPYECVFFACCPVSPEASYFLVKGEVPRDQRKEIPEHLMWSLNRDEGYPKPWCYLISSDKRLSQLRCWAKEKTSTSSLANLF